MTEKQTRILQTALKLFAQQGFDSTSTSKVAVEAGVSEGLIFRHYKNKQGLLDAIIEQGMCSASAYILEILKIKSPKDMIKASISLPFNIDKTEHDFWRLMYALKWQRGVYQNEVFDPLNKALVIAFSQLGYENPKEEADFVEVITDGVATGVLLKDADYSGMLKMILNKYDIK